MKLVDELVSRAVADDRAMGDLADTEAAALEKRQAYNRIEATFDQMARDGFIDQNELDELKRQFKAEGLDTATLDRMQAELDQQDGASRVPVSEFSFEIQSELDLARQTADTGPEANLRAQMLIDDHNQALDAASRCLKAEHEIYMVAIKHLVA